MREAVTRKKASNPNEQNVKTINQQNRKLQRPLNSPEFYFKSARLCESSEGVRCMTRTKLSAKDFSGQSSSSSNLAVV